MICLQTSTVFWLGGRTADVSCQTCVGLTLILITWRIWWAPNNASRWQIGFNLAFSGLMLLCSRLQYIQLSHRCLGLVVLRLGWLLAIGNDTNQWVVTEYDHHWSSQWWSTDSLILSGMRKIAVDGERRQSPWTIYKNGIKVTVAMAACRTNTTFYSELFVHWTYGQSYFWYLQRGLRRNRSTDTYVLITNKCTSLLHI